MHACSRVHHKLPFLRFYCGCDQQTPLIGRRIECCVVRFFELKDTWQVSTRLRGRIAPVFQSPPETDPQILERMDKLPGNRRWV